MKQKNKTIITAEPGKQEMFIIREFEAPRELIFRTFTEPDLFVQWLGPRGLTMILKTFEPQTGGTWRYIHQDPQGNEYGFHGVFHEVTAPERIIQTFEFEGMLEAGHVLLETLKLEALPEGRTKIVIQSIFQSVADRDGMIESGMEEGINDGYEQLDELLQRIG